MTQALIVNTGNSEIHGATTGVKTAILELKETWSMDQLDCVDLQLFLFIHYHINLLFYIILLYFFI